MGLGPNNALFVFLSILVVVAVLVILVTQRQKADPDSPEISRGPLAPMVHFYRGLLTAAGLVCIFGIRMVVVGYDSLENAESYAEISTCSCWYSDAVSGRSESQMGLRELARKGFAKKLQMGLRASERKGLAKNKYENKGRELIGWGGVSIAVSFLFVSFCFAQLRQHALKSTTSPEISPG